jgi:PPOX class probable F420-dependent enzyme
MLEMPPPPTSELFRPFAKQRYLNFESYRRNGDAVRTPLWFVEMDGSLYVRTPDDTSKLKRIRRNPHVRVAVCDIRGRLKGDWVDATARIVEGPEADRANRLLSRKYGLLKLLIDLGTWLRRHGYVVIVVEARETSGG